MRYHYYLILNVRLNKEESNLETMFKEFNFRLTSIYSIRKAEMLLKRSMQVRKVDILNFYLAKQEI